MTGTFVTYIINTSTLEVLRVVDPHTLLLSNCNIFEEIDH
jgi:hypothetical protein